MLLLFFISFRVLSYISWAIYLIIEISNIFGYNLFLKPDGLVNQHNGDIVADFILELAGVADKPVPVIRQVNIPFAFGARQDIQQLLVNGHHFLLTRTSRN